MCCVASETNTPHADYLDKLSQQKSMQKKQNTQLQPPKEPIPQTLLFKPRSFPQRRIQNLLTNTQTLRRNLQKLIRINKVQSLLQA